MRFLSSLAIVGLIAAMPAHADDSGGSPLTPDMQVCLHGSVMAELLEPHPRLHADDDDFATAAVKGIRTKITETCGLRASEWPAAVKFVSGILEGLKRAAPTEAAKPNEPPASNDDSIEKEEARKRNARAASGYRDPPGTRELR